MARAYGTRARRLLGTASARGDLGAEFGAGLTEAELAYLMDAEWARTAEDVVWRRSKLGLRMSRGQIEAIELGMNERRREGAGRAAQ